ncbi:GNAT family N-acetyltransferase [Exiguobacterium sp. RIT341]|uniref:GNAT family N-acetyltransferase n=1 Tax=Exiguobacterium sp. RIT341 TaxID=1470592 RepID=UPI000448814A|nr:GNAT family N-acetyltransferase [Exiguobacterium sp. RIT341]EZP61529.1 Acetyltransferase [Exiguobacterium sp. RIT341]
MCYTFSPLTQRQAEQIAYEWQYDGPFAFYDMPNDVDDLAEFLNPEERTEHYFAVLNRDELIGYYVFEPNADVVDVGLGMRPDLTGRGNGVAFLEAGLAFIMDRFAPKQIELAVATFNERAIRLYTKSGFLPVERFQQATNGGSYEFLKMRLQPIYSTKHFPKFVSR